MRRRRRKEKGEEEGGWEVSQRGGKSVGATIEATMVVVVVVVAAATVVVAAAMEVRCLHYRSIHPQRLSGRHQHGHEHRNSQPVKVGLETWGDCRRRARSRHGRDRGQEATHPRGSRAASRKKCISSTDSI